MANLKGRSASKFPLFHCKWRRGHEEIEVTIGPSLGTIIIALVTTINSNVLASHIGSLLTGAGLIATGLAGRRWWRSL